MMKILDESHDRNMMSTHGNRRHSNLSNLEKNCSQIFVKAPAITREFFEKINHDVVPQKTELFGYQMNTRRFIVLTGLILLFSLSTIGTITMWFTDTFQKRLDAMTVLSADSMGFEIWRAPPPKPLVKIYIFNYTNVEDYETKKVDKLHVEEVGPYVYFEVLEKVNIKFNKVDGTVSYQEKRTYVFSPELSKGSKDDLVIVPNVPLLAGAAVVKNFNFLMRLGYNGILQSLREKPFVSLKAHNFIDGYEDNLYELSKNYLKFEDKRVFEKFGILVWKKGTQPDIITLNTGAHDINRLGQIEKFNGQTQYDDMWTSEACNQIPASDGIMYPANQVKGKKDLEIFVPQMCRKLKMQFVEEKKVLDKVPVHRYRLPMNAFDSVDTKENQCYCEVEQGICPPKGLFNATKCSFGAPMFYSWPHFYGTDAAVQEGVTGLNKNPILNDTYADLHSKYGIMVSGKLKIQVNIEMQKSFGLTDLNKYPDGLMLPLVWLDIGLEVDDLPADIVNMIYQMTFTVRNVELGLKYGCLLATTVTLTCILLVLKKHRTSRSRVDSMRRPISLDA